MFLRLKHKLTSFSSSRARNGLLKKIEHALFNVKGFHLKEIFLAQDNLRAIAIDRSGRSLNLISIENGEIKTCLVQYSDLFAVEMFMRGKSFDKLSRQTGLTQNQQQNLLSDKLTEHLKKVFPKSSRVLCLHTSKKSTPLFVIDFHSKSINPNFAHKTELGADSKASKTLAIHWLENCKKIISKGEQKAVDSRIANSLSPIENAEEVFEANSLSA